MERRKTTATATKAKAAAVRKRTRVPVATRTETAAVQPQPASATNAFKFGAGTIKERTTYEPYKALVLAFNKHIAVEFEQRINGLMGKGVVGSEEQEEFWRVLLTGSAHIMGVAVAGSGKTFTAVHGIQLLREKLGGELSVEVRTYHSHGMRAINAAAREKGVRKVEVNEQWLVDDYLRQEHDIRSVDDWREVSGLVKRLASIVKGSLVRDGDNEELVRLADHYGLDTNGVFRAAVPYVWRFIEWSGQEIGRRSINYDDMPWLPVRLGLDLGRWDLVLVDEAQDTNPVQAAMVRMMVEKGARVVVLGDPRQAIYGFRGADVRAMVNIKEMLCRTREVKELGLTYTRRCGKKIVEAARVVVPVIHAMPDAPEGKVRVMWGDERDGKRIVRTEEEMMLAAVKEVKEGDMVLCRANAPLIEFAYGVLKRGVKAVIRGREIGKALADIVRERLTGDDPNTFRVSLVEWFDGEDQKLARLGERGQNKRAALSDRMDCLMTLMQTVEGGKWRGVFEGGEDSFKELMVARIEGLFADVDEDGRKRVGVLCGTVHKMKGLEAEKVWLIKPELIPHPKVKSGGWEYEQEKNIFYVAVTRAREELVVVGSMPGIGRDEEGEE